MRLLFATDVHGRLDHLRELLGLAERLGPDLLVLGGDDLPEAGRGNPLDSQVRFAREEFRDYLRDLRERCPATRVVSILGNHDWLCSAHALEDLEAEGLLRILRPDGSFSLAGWTFVGYSHVPPSPHPVKDFERLDFPGQAYPFGVGAIWDPASRRAREIDPAAYLPTVATIREDLARIAQPATADWVLVTHAPPRDTVLDVLDHAGHVGSRSIHEFIVERQPALSLHGHIHESPALTGRFWQQIGRTVAINPGQRDDALASVQVDLSAEAIMLTPWNVERAGREPIVLPRKPIGRSP